jgi:hypothetical protein
MNRPILHSAVIIANVISLDPFSGILILNYRVIRDGSDRVPSTMSRAGNRFVLASTIVPVVLLEPG